MSLPARRTLFFYALPALPLAAMALPFYVMVPTFYAETMGISAAGLGLVLLAIRLFDAVSDPLVGLFADRVSLKWGRRRSVFLAFAPAAGLAAFMLAGFLREGDLVAFALICIATGLLLGFDVTLPPAIQADVIDLDTMKSGEQRTGLFFAIWGLATKLSLALATGLVFPLLALSGFVTAGTEPQPPQALAMLSALYAWLPVLPKLIAIALMWRFPISGTEQQQMRVALESER